MFLEVLTWENTRGWWVWVRSIWKENSSVSLDMLTLGFVCRPLLAPEDTAHNLL